LRFGDSASNCSCLSRLWIEVVTAHVGLSNCRPDLRFSYWRAPSTPHPMGLTVRGDGFGWAYVTHHARSTSERRAPTVVTKGTAGLRACVRARVNGLGNSLLEGTLKVRGRARGIGAPHPITPPSEHAVRMHPRPKKQRAIRIEQRGSS